MAWLLCALTWVSACTWITDPNDYEGGDGSTAGCADGSTEGCLDAGGGGDGGDGSMDACDGGCPDGAVCDPDAGACVECVTAMDCAAGEICVGNVCMVDECAGSNSAAPVGLPLMLPDSPPSMGPATHRAQVAPSPTGAGWLVAGRVSDTPPTYWLAEVDRSGDVVTTHDDARAALADLLGCSSDLFGGELLDLELRGKDGELSVAAALFDTGGVKLVRARKNASGSSCDRSANPIPGRYEGHLTQADFGDTHAVLGLFSSDRMREPPWTIRTYPATAANGQLLCGAGRTCLPGAALSYPIGSDGARGLVAWSLRTEGGDQNAVVLRNKDNENLRSLPWFLAAPVGPARLASAGGATFLAVPALQETRGTCAPAAMTLGSTTAGDATYCGSGDLEGGHIGVVPTHGGSFVTVYESGDGLALGLPLQSTDGAGGDLRNAAAQDVSGVVALDVAARRFGDNGTDVAAVVATEDGQVSLVRWRVCGTP